MCNKYIVTCKNPTQDIFVLSHDTNNALNERGRRCEHKRHNRSLRSKQPQPHLGQGYGHHREQGTGRKDHGKVRGESEHRDLAGEGDLRRIQPLHRLWSLVERQPKKKETTDANGDTKIKMLRSFSKPTFSGYWNKGNIDSHYRSARDQAGFFAGRRA